MPVPSFVADKLPQLRELCLRYHVTHLALFGSAATGQFDPSRSDLDFVVQLEFETGDGSSLAHNFFDLSHALERLFGRKVDLISSRSTMNRHFRQELDETAVPLYDA